MVRPGIGHRGFTIRILSHPRRVRRCTRPGGCVDQRTSVGEDRCRVQPGIRRQQDRDRSARAEAERLHRGVSHRQGGGPWPGRGRVSTRRRREYERSARGGAKPNRQPDQSSVPEQHKLQRRPLQSDPKRPEYPAGHSIQTHGRLESHHSLDHAHRLPAATFSGGRSRDRTGEHSAGVLPVSHQTIEWIHLGYGSSILFADRDRQNVGRQRMGCGTGLCGAHNSGAVGLRRSHQQHLGGGRRGSSSIRC